MKNIFIISAIIIGLMYSVSNAWVPGEDFTDTRDGKIYKTAKIGTQVWMTENLNIGELTMSTQAGYQMTNNGVIERYCWDNGVAGCDGTNGQMKRGGFYEWKEALQNYSGQQPQLPARGICPNGWHIPSNTEWNTLFTATGAQDNASLANALLVGGSSGFNALLTGYRCTFTGSFRVSATAADTRTYYWTSEQADAENAPAIEIGVSSFTTFNIPKSIGLCIRCIADEQAAGKPIINILKTDVDFGETMKDSTQVYELKIKNAGDAELSITKATINNNPDKVFIVLNPGYPYKIKAGTIESIFIKFTPKESKTYNSQLVITSNDVTNPNLQIDLIGKGISTKSQISCSAGLDMGEVLEGNTATKVFNVSNNGDGELKINNIQLMNNNQEVFSINTMTFPININSKGTLDVNLDFNPLEAGDYSATMRIYSNDLQTPEKDVIVTGKGLSHEAVGEETASFTVSVSPNPFRSSAICTINMIEMKNIQIELCDITGRIIQDIHNGILPIGIKTFNIDGTNLISGVYIIKIKVDNITTTTKIVFTK